MEIGVLELAEDVSGTKWMMAGICFALLLASCTDEAAPPARATHDPYPYTTPTPPSEPTPLDGIYVRTVTAEVLGGAGACRRCPPYRLAIGEDVLGFENGVFEVYHRGSGYLSVGHFTTDGSSVTLFNDANCPQDRGTYGVTSTDRVLSLAAINDACAYDGVRVQFLTAVPWVKLESPAGIYTTAAEDVLVLLNGEFLLDREGQEITGTATVTSDLITLDGPFCRQGFDWSGDQGALRLTAIAPACQADWVTDLTKAEWTGVG